jgi:hypothetical protein
MDFIPLFAAAIAVLPVFGVVAWVWLAMASANDDVPSCVGFEAVHLDD